MSHSGQAIRHHPVEAYTFPDAPLLCFRIGSLSRYLSPVVFLNFFANLHLLTCKEFVCQRTRYGYNSPVGLN